MHHPFPHRPLAVLALLPVFALLSGCQIPQESAQPARQLEYKLPVLTPVEASKQDQEKDGIRIDVAGYTYAPKQQLSRVYRRVPALLVANNQFPIDVKLTPSIEIFPKDVRFKVKIYNRLERVLRLSGTVVSFQAAGKTLAIAKGNYDDFLNGIILPRQEGDYEIAGPDLATLPDNTTIGLFLYDIVTETDAAGNATKRSNFEYYYTLSREAKTEDGTPTVKRITGNQLFVNLIAQQDRGNMGQWVKVQAVDRIIDSGKEQ